MTNYFTFKDDIFNSYFVVVTGEPEEAIKSLIKKGLENSFEELSKVIVGNRGGCAFELEADNGGIGYCIWIRQTKDIDELRKVIDHECYHATSFAMDTIGLTHSIQTEEVYAYFKSWLTDKLFSKLVKSRKNSKTAKRRNRNV